MENKINMIITLDNDNKYMVIDQGIYQKRNFLLLGKVDNNGNLTDELSITEEVSGNITDVTDENILKVLRDYFERRVSSWS